MAAQSLVFQSTQFDVVDRNNQPWLRLPQIAECLYSKGGDQNDPPFESQVRQVQKLYQRHADEFTDAMTALVKLPSSGGMQETRIFSLRGAHLLGMFARTKIAKEFRKWVLDILDRETGIPLPQQQFITAGQAGELATLIKERFPDGVDRAYAWSRFNKHFRIARYRELPQSKFLDACKYIPTMPSKDEGEVKALPSPKLAINPPTWTRPGPLHEKGADRSIDASRKIITELKMWANTLPHDIGSPLWDALDDLTNLLIAGWTEVDEALLHISVGTGYLKRWMGRERQVSKK